MSIEVQIWWLRVKRVARYNARRAVDMLLAIGADFAKAIKFVALARSVAL